MNQQTTVQRSISEMIETEPIRDIVERHPDVMPILAGHGLDLCCGGSHTIAEAARQHGLNRALIAEQIAAAIAVRARG